MYTFVLEEDTIKAKKKVINGNISKPKKYVLCNCRSAGSLSKGKNKVTGSWRDLHDAPLGGMPKPWALD